MARTPSKEAHEKVLRAALALISERGVDGVSMDAIAAASGVSKATVYKHWANKDALLIDTVRHWSGDPPEFDSGNAREDLVALIRHLGQVRKRPELEKVWPRLMSYAVGNPDFARALQQFLWGPRRLQIARLLGQAAETGELQPDIDPGFAMDLLIGPLMHRRLTCDNSVPADFPERIVEYFWRAFGSNCH